MTIIAAGLAFLCSPLAVYDADGPLWCAEGPRIRLAGIAAREMDGTCSRGHPCPGADPEAAKATLVSLVGKPVGTGPYGHTIVEGPAMRCISTGSAGGNRTGAWCISPIGGDLSCAMVRGGWAARWDRYWKDHRCE